MANSQLLVLSFLVLLPMIPSFLLFKLLPSRAVVRGPLAGLNVALGGAFAGYVALTVFVATFYAQSLKPPARTYRIWTVSGQLQFPPGERPQIGWDLGPPLLTLDRSNSFYLAIPLADGAEMPDLVLEAPGYAPKSIRLRKEAGLGIDYACAINAKDARIQLGKPIVFEKPPTQTYAPPPEQPVQLAGGL
ncbi:MAG TPA: hypothetical protein VGF28_08825 [Thermoanaerobaculia bacterium]|jgi:hypothetical protein